MSEPITPPLHAADGDRLLKPRLRADEDGRILSVSLTNVAPPGDDWVTVTEEQAQRALAACERVRWTGTDLEPCAPLPQPVPQPPLARHQFFQQLAADGIIAPSEALAAVRTGVVPPALEATLAGDAPEAQFAAEMVLSGAPAFASWHPVTRRVLAGLGWDEARIAAFWTQAEAR